jgi:hypothetical protein
MTVAFRMTLATLSAVACTTASAATFTIDQHNDSQVTFSGLTTRQTIGQSFRPTVGSMNAVELQINDQSPSFIDGPTDLFVRIRAGTIGGSILGTSAATSCDDQLSGDPVLTRFLFGAPVALTPGSTYWIEFVMGDISYPGNFGVLATGYGFDGYPAGEPFGDAPGFSDPSLFPFDLWFRQGNVAVVPVPAGLPLFLSGLLLAGVYARRGARRNA